MLKERMSGSLPDAQALRLYRRELDALEVVRGNAELRKNLGARIQALREEMGLTRSEMAHFIETSPPIYAAFENGSRVPNLETLHKFQLLRKGVDHAMKRADSIRMA